MDKTLDAHIASALADVARAAEAIAEWQQQGEPVNGRHWVAAGHDAVTQLDRAAVHLSYARRDLVTAMRADEDARGERIDAMLAESQAARERFRHSPPVSAGGDVVRPDGPTGRFLHDQGVHEHCDPGACDAAGPSQAEARASAWATYGMVPPPELDDATVRKVLDAAPWWTPGK